MNDFGWKERLGLTEQWVAPTFQGFATADEETMVADNDQFYITDLQKFLESKINHHSSVKWERKGQTQTITVCAVTCCDKGLFLSSESVKFHYSNESESLPALLEGDWDIYFLAEKLANDLGIRFYK